MLSFRIGGNEGTNVDFPCRVVAVARAENGNVRLGLEFEQSPAQHDTGLRLPASTPLYGLIEHPFLYDQTALIRVLSVSREKLLVRCEDRSFAVFPTMGVVFSLNLFGSQEPVHGRVVSSRSVDGGTEFVVEITAMTRETSEGLVRYVLTLVDIEPFELRKVGFETNRIKDIINYRFVRSQQEYYEVLQLRHITYAAVKKLSRDADLTSSSHDYDAHSRILGAWHHNRLVGSAALFFPDGKTVPFEVQKCLSPADFRKLPNPSEMMEVAGLCLHHNYRKSDILVGIFQRIFKTMIETKKTYILACCDSYLWKIYESIGFKKTGLSYTVMKNNRPLTLHVILVHRHVGAYGWSLDPMRWQEIYAGMSDFLDSQGKLPRSPRHLAVSPIYKAYIRSMNLLNPENRPPDQLIADLASNEVIRRLLGAFGLRPDEPPR